MRKADCPACGAELIFKTVLTITMVCPYCKSTVVRHDLQLENLGVVAELQDDLTPFQIGTRGRIDHEAFEIIGRLRIRWSYGFWNEWAALFDNGRMGWLAEAQGFYGICFEVEEEGLELPETENLSPGQRLELLPNQWFTVDDIKQATCIGLQGELPRYAQKGRTTTSVDLSGDGQQFACLEYEPGPTGSKSASASIGLSIGSYLEFDDFQFINLREQDGW